jgi:hypothetical protein
VAKTLQSSPTNQQLAIELLTKYPKQHQCVLLALLALLHREDAVAKDAHQALQVLDGDRFQRTTLNHSRNSAGLPNLTSIAHYKQQVEQDELSEMELAESELGFLHSWQTEPEMPVRIEIWLSNRSPKLKIATVAKWCYIHEYPTYHTTIVAQMHEKAFITLNDISMLLEHQDLYASMGAAEMLRNLIDNKQIADIDTSFWANCLGRAVLRHPDSALTISGAILSLGESKFTEDVFFRCFAQDLLSDDGNIVCEARVILTEIAPECARKLGLTLGMRVRGDNIAQALNNLERQKVLEAIKIHSSEK